jgi:hypothetical protein
MAIGTIFMQINKLIMNNRDFLGVALILRAALSALAFCLLRRKRAQTNASIANANLPFR